MKIIITEEQKKKLFVPRRIDEREKELKEYLVKIIKSEDFNENLKEYILEWWPDVSDFDKWLEEHGWYVKYITESQYKQLGDHIVHSIGVEHFFDFVYGIMDFEQYIDSGKIVLNKLKEMGYLYI